MPIHSETVLIAEVNCTAEVGRPLCDRHKIFGYPTLMCSDAYPLQAYLGEGINLNALKKFIDEKLQTMCSVTNIIKICDEEKNATIQKYHAMPCAELDSIAEKDAQVEATWKEFEDEVSKLYAEFERLLALGGINVQQMYKLRDMPIKELDALIAEPMLGGITAIRNFMLDVAKW